MEKDDQVGNAEKPLHSTDGSRQRPLNATAATIEAAIGRHFLNSDTDCMTLVAPDGTLEFMNDSARRALDVAPDVDPAGVHWSRFWPESSRQHVRKAIEAASSGSSSTLRGLEHRSAGAHVTA
ncbi:MAG: PAS domain-containing protein [Hyphomicrobiaceae bacterium]